MFYLQGKYITQNFSNCYQLLLSAINNNCIDAYYVFGYIHHEGKFVKQDINLSIKYYKEASSFYNSFAKNNLGIIYKNGYGDTVPKSLGNSIIYFEEAIRQNADRVCMYNLAHLYFYDIKDKYDESINLLIQSLNLKFEPARYLLYLVLIKKYEQNKNEINEKLKCIELAANDHDIENFMLKYNDLYDHYRKVDFLYRYNQKYFMSSLLDKLSYPNQFHDSKKKTISDSFYEGFYS